MRRADNELAACQSIFGTQSLLDLSSHRAHDCDRIDRHENHRSLAGLLRLELG